MAGKQKSLGSGFVVNPKSLGMSRLEEWIFYATYIPKCLRYDLHIQYMQQWMVNNCCISPSCVCCVVIHLGHDACGEHMPMSLRTSVVELTLFYKSIVTIPFVFLCHWKHTHCVCLKWHSLKLPTSLWCITISTFWLWCIWVRVCHPLHCNIPSRTPCSVYKDLCINVELFWQLALQWACNTNLYVLQLHTQTFLIVTLHHLTHALFLRGHPCVYKHYFHCLRTFLITFVCHEWLDQCTFMWAFSIGPFVAYVFKDKMSRGRYF